MNKAFLEEFANPSNAYRAAPFWAWNGRLDPEELRRQIRLLRDMGTGGFFMHSRVGLDTPYLSEEWMKCIAACVDEAEKLDMKAWLYDEDRWPSGSAGGLVTRDPRYRQRQLTIEILAGPATTPWDAEVLAVFAGRTAADAAAGRRAYTLGDNRVVPSRTAGAAEGLRRLAHGAPAAVAAGESLLVFREKTAPCISWYNGYTYLDTMNHEAVREFIRVTHEAYRGRFGEHFGKRIPGIFTDEPNYGGHGLNVFVGATGVFVPWTPRLPEVFRERYGYDLLDHLPELFLLVDGRTESPARYHYHDCLTYLFCDAFARQIGEWCAANGLEHTGHVLHEETLDTQTNMVGSAMRFYEHMQAPGLDLLTEYSREYDTAKQVSSAARQFGRRWRLTETYGCTGWDFPFAGHKALSDWQAALGINLRCPHLSWYTMEGQAKRDYPAGIFYQSPWWSLYPKIEDYFARVHVAMSRGREVRDILVVHPVESMWLIYVDQAKTERQQLQDAFWKLRDTLLAANLDFDYGDEDILARHGRVIERDGRSLFVVGQAEYRAVVVPQTLTMRRSTLDLLRAFRQAGGTVIFAADGPGRVDADPSDEPRRLAAECVTARGDALAAALEPVGRRVSIADADGRQIVPTLYCLREDDDAWYLFVCNTGHDNFGRDSSDPMVRDRTLSFDDVRITVAAETAAPPLELECDTGQAVATDAHHAAHGWEIRTNLAALGSRLFILPKVRSNKRFPRRPALQNVRVQPLRPAKWEILLDEPNVLVLDRPRYRIGDGRWRSPQDALLIDREVRDALGLPHRGGHMKQPWATEKPSHPRHVEVALDYTFAVKALPTHGPLQLGIERPETFTIQLNGRPVSTDVECGWWVDRSLRTVPLDPALLRLGDNRLSLVCHYSELHPGLEIVYLLGQFGAAVAGTAVTLTATPTSLKLGDWTAQGLPFYSGSVCYRQRVQPKLRKGERLFVTAAKFSGAAIRILVDGRPAGLLGWPPYELDITDLVSNGKPVVLDIQVIGHRRNSHGPLHLDQKWPRWTGPDQFTPGKHYYEGYQLVPCGLMAPPQLVVRKKA
jgi:hypothetical protein